MGFPREDRTAATNPITTLSLSSSFASQEGIGTASVPFIVNSSNNNNNNSSSNRDNNRDKEEKGKWDGSSIHHNKR